MGDEDSFSRSEIPDVKVVDIDDSLDLLKLLLDIINFDIFWGGLHDDLIAVLGNGPGRGDDDQAENVGGDGVE